MMLTAVRKRRETHRLQSCWEIACREIGLGEPKSLQMVIAAMNLKDAFSLDTVAPQFEKNHKMPPTRRDGGLLFLPDLESNPWSSLQTSQED